jgi:hypothetical protein
MQPAAGTGHLIHTYKCDGNPVPSFEGEPVQTEISGDIESLAGEIWETLNAERKVSLYVRYIDIAGGEYKAKLINKNG